MFDRITEKTCGFIDGNILNKIPGAEVGVIFTWSMNLRSRRRMCFNLTLRSRSGYLDFFKKGGAMIHTP